MIEDPKIKAILFNNGGYGFVRILDHIDSRSLRLNPKWLVGYSDLIMLQYAVRKRGVESIHSTMSISFLKDSIGETQQSVFSLRDALIGRLIKIELNRLRGGLKVVLLAEIYRWFMPHREVMLIT